MSGRFFALLADRFEGLEDHLNRLDAATGDGDHGSTIMKGLRAAAKDDDPAIAFRKAAGGASGSLFAMVLGALETVLKGEKTLGEALDSAATNIAQIGGGKAGDKTMLDALIPAAKAALKDPDQAAHAAAMAAKDGAKATRAMVARRGRAKYVQGAGVGHLDAGAISIAEILDALDQYSGSRKTGGN